MVLVFDVKRPRERWSFFEPGCRRCPARLYALRCHLAASWFGCLAAQVESGHAGDPARRRRCRKFESARPTLNLASQRIPLFNCPTSDPVDGTGCRRGGKCKWFNVAKGWGFITPFDGGPDVFVHQSVIQMTGFRSLGDDEEVEFECKRSGKGFEATMVTGPEGHDCRGSHRRPMSKKRFKKVRCYNCGEFANHMAAKCTLGPQPKRCHHCKSSDHLIADCPLREEKKRTSSTGGKTKNGDGRSTDSGTERDGEESLNHKSPDELTDATSATPTPPPPSDKQSSRVRAQADSAADSSSGESERV